MDAASPNGTKVLASLGVVVAILAGVAMIVSRSSSLLSQRVDMLERRVASAEANLKEHLGRWITTDNFAIHQGYNKKRLDELEQWRVSYELRASMANIAQRERVLALERKILGKAVNPVRESDGTLE